MSLPETLLWRALKTRPAGLRFRKQHPAGPFILDFYCPSARLAIEVDGAVHDQPDRQRADIARDRWLAASGVDTLRVPACDILTDLAAVIEHIIAAALPDQPLHCPADGYPPRTGEE